MRVAPRGARGPAPSSARMTGSARIGTFCDPSAAICASRCRMLRVRDSGRAAPGGRRRRRPRAGRGAAQHRPTTSSTHGGRRGPRSRRPRSRARGCEPAYAMSEWDPLSSHSFRVSNGRTSSTNMRARRLPVGPTRGEVAGQHPLRERLGRHRSRGPRRRSARATSARSSSVDARRDAVDHRRHEGDVARRSTRAGWRRRARRGRRRRGRPWRRCRARCRWARWRWGRHRLHVGPTAPRRACPGSS